MSDPYRRNAKVLILDPAWCSSCQLERKRGTLDVCECGDRRPPIAPRTYKCEGFVPHPTCPNLCARCGAGSHARNEHLKECFFNPTCGRYVADPVTDDLCNDCKYARQIAAWRKRQEVEQKLQRFARAAALCTLFMVLPAIIAMFVYGIANLGASW